MAGELETIRCATEGAVRVITLARPDVLNAFSDRLTDELAAALKAAAKSDGVRALVLTGDGRAFSSGQDLDELKARYVPGYVPELGEDLRRRYNPIIRQIREMDKPVIAAVNGVAAGAGCSLALACDVRIASEKASFIEVFINVGLIPDSGSTFVLPRLVGLGRALEMCWSGRKVDAAEALSIGLVSAVVAPDALMPEAMKVASRLASLPARAIALTKRLLNESWTNDLAAQLQAEAFAQETAGKTEDHREGVTAFLEKREPRYRGR
jgi:2-(1,2-epoxy-1,2-dihydrophenyl)acetyl-CoA isomerase